MGKLISSSSPIWPNTHAWSSKAERGRCLKLRRRILEMSQTVSALHIAGAFSCLEIVDTLYFGLMHHGKGV